MLCEVPENCTVVGVPGRIVKRNNVRVDNSLMDQRLPDPMLEELQRMCSRICELERTVKREKERKGEEK